MKLSVCSGEDARTIPADSEKLHLVRPVEAKILKALIGRESLKEITLSPSCAGRLSSKAKRMIRERGILLKEERNSGRAISIGLDKIREIVSMHRDDKSYRDIEGITGIPKSTAHYLIRYANRNKLKKGGHTVYLE